MKTGDKTKKTGYTGIGRSTADNEEFEPYVNRLESDETEAADEDFGCNQICPSGDGETGSTVPPCPGRIEEDRQ